IVSVRYGATGRLRPSTAASHLAFDLCQLGGLLALTGGLLNPFSILLLAPVSISATSLPSRETLLVSLLAAVIASAIAVLHLPLPWAPGEELVFNRVYVIGIWVAIICG